MSGLQDPAIIPGWTTSRKSLYGFCEAFQYYFDGISGIKRRQRGCYRL